MTVTRVPTPGAGPRCAPWLVACVATAVLGVVQGVFGSVGVLVDPMAAVFGADRGVQASVFAAALAVHTLAAHPAGRAVDRFGPRPLLGVAAVGMAVGLGAPAVADALPVAVVGYGLGLGVASACSWVATATAVGAAFRGRSAAAMGLLTAGPAAGGAVLAPAVTGFVQAHGLRPTCAALATVGVLTCGAGALLLQVRPVGTGEAATGPAVNLRPILTAAALMGCVVFLPLVYAVGTATGLGLSPFDGAAVLAVVSGVSAATRLAVGRSATPRTLRPLYVAAHVTVSAGLVVWAVAASGNGAAFALLLAAGGLFGAGYGAWLALGPAFLTALCPPGALGRALGAMAAAVGVGGVAGPLLAGPAMTSAPVVVWLGAAAVGLAAAATLRGTGSTAGVGRASAKAAS